MDQFQQLSPDENPLSTADYRAMQSALATLNRAKRKLQHAQQAGVDCSDREGQCAYLEDRIGKLKAIYFPHKA